jgi:hypothetical protein
MTDWQLMSPRPGPEVLSVALLDGGLGQSPVPVVSLPARGRPPAAAARRAGLELVWKVLTAALSVPVEPADAVHRQSQAGHGRLRWLS